MRDCTIKSTGLMGNVRARAQCSKALSVIIKNKCQTEQQILYVISLTLGI